RRGGGVLRGGAAGAGTRPAEAGRYTECCGHHAFVFSAQHRDRRLLLARAGADVQFPLVLAGAGPQLHHRLGAVRRGHAHRRHRPAQPGHARGGDRPAVRDRAEVLPARPGPPRRAVSRRLAARPGRVARAGQRAGAAIRDDQAPAGAGDFVTAWLLLALFAIAPRFERTVTPGAKGPNRLDVDVALLAGARPPDLGDLRLHDAA